VTEEKQEPIPVRDRECCDPRIPRRFIRHRRKEGTDDGDVLRLGVAAA
jgi:hypothetical protein